MTLWVDPETGMALEEGCRPRRGEPRREHLLAGTEPPAVCPRRGGENLFERIGSWLGSVFGLDTGPETAGEPDPHLGVPRLPRRDEAGEGVEDEGRREAESRGPV